MKIRQVFPALLLAAMSAAIPPTLHSELIAYCAFTQSPGTENPGSESDENTGRPASLGGTGFQRLKANPGRSRMIVTEKGLSFTAAFSKLSVAGNAVEIAPGISPSYLVYAPYEGDPFAKLRSPDNPAVFGCPDSSLWFSCLMRVSGEITTSTLAAVKLGSDAIQAGLINNEKAASPFFRLISASTKIIAEPDRTYLLVARIDYGPKNSANDKTDRIMLWIDPELGESEPALSPQARISNVWAPFGGVWFLRGPFDETKSVVLDEIRLGETYVDVVPVAK